MGRENSHIIKKRCGSAALMLLAARIYRHTLSHFSDDAAFDQVLTRETVKSKTGCSEVNMLHRG
jgi:hypothetical protein